MLVVFPSKCHRHYAFTPVSMLPILTVSDVTEEMVALLDPARREEITRGSASPSGSMHRKTQFVVTERLPRTLEAALASMPRPMPLEWGLTVVVGVRGARHGVSSVTSLVATWSLPPQRLMLSFSSLWPSPDRQGAFFPC